MRGVCLIYDWGSDPGMQPWFDMPESDPHTRARLRTANADPVLLTIEDDGSITGNYDLVDFDTTFEEVPPSTPDQAPPELGK